MAASVRGVLVRAPTRRDGIDYERGTKMTIYRTVCPQCSFYIRSEDIDSTGDLMIWIAESDAWIEGHVCGQDQGNGNEMRYYDARYYAAWMQRVDDLVWQIMGCSFYDLPDCCIRDWYEDGLSIHQAAARAIRDTG